MQFTAIDVETANSKLSSICQIGVAVFEQQKLVDEWEQLVDPEDYFDQINTSIHGIQPEHVQNSPTLGQLQAQLRRRLSGIVVSHTHFDRTAIRQACEKYSIEPPTCEWLDSARVARRAWEQFSRSGYGLKNVCSEIGYEFRHHDALEDAKAAGAVLIAACDKTGHSPGEWLKLFSARSKSCSGGGGQQKPLTREANPDGYLFGDTILFTGALEVPRATAADMAAKVGCEVVAGFSKKVTILCVGDQDVERLAGHKKSSKHRKAEEAIAAGQPLRIVRESDFMALVNA